MSVRLLTLREPTPREPVSPRRAPPPRFASLYRTHYDFVWRCALRLGVEPAEVDDVVQETFLIALRRLDEFTDEGAARPSTWLFAILRNVLRNHARGQRRRSRKQQAFGELRAGWVHEREAERGLGIGLLDQFLASLDPERRSVFVLAELEGHDSRAISEALGINHNTARTRLRAARKAFAAAFERDDEAREQLERAVARSRSDPPHADEGGRERVLQAILVGAPLELVGGASSGLGVAAWLGKLTIAVASLGMITSVATVVEMKQRERAPARVAAERVRVQRPRSDSSPTSTGLGSTELEVALAAQPEPPALEPPARSKVPTKKDAPTDEPSPQLEALRTLTEARAALLRGEAQDVLRLVQARTWPDAALADRAAALEIGALCALDRRADAKAIADAHPDRWLLDRAACW